MTIDPQPQLAAHLQRHARTLFRIACGFGRQRDGEDIVQTLYARWWRRMKDEPSWTLPETHAELFVCVRRIVIDVAAKEKRDRLRNERAGRFTSEPDAPDESLHAFERLQWILARLPAPLAAALTASLSAGRRDDAALAEELGLTVSAFTGRLFKARRAAEELASFYELLSLDEATLMAELRYGGKTRTQLAHELGIRPDELAARSQRAIDLLEKTRRAAS
jgi:DNA-directed RNA polymerase specialized sigma24 family protein